MARTRRRATPVVIDAARGVVRTLRAHPEGASLAELQAAVGAPEGASGPTLRRALDWLREDQDAPLVFSPVSRRWVLEDPHISMPLVDPSADDLVAVLFAASLLAPLADARLSAQIERIVEDMDGKVNEGGSGLRLRRGALVASMSHGKPIDSQLFARLILSAGRGVLRVIHKSPWNPVEKTHDVEVWQLRIHDGVAYLRGWSRQSEGPRTFRVADLRHVRELEGDAPRQPMPRAADLWGQGDPASGVDLDRPGHARVVVRGGIARWLAQERWHPAQRDTWLERDEILERQLPYPSCRELARKLLSLGAGLVSVEPNELRDELRAHIDAMAANLGSER